jgi:hypothetical protein
MPCPDLYEYLSIDLRGARTFHPCAFALHARLPWLRHANDQRAPRSRHISDAVSSSTAGIAARRSAFPRTMAGALAGRRMSWRRTLTPGAAGPSSSSHSPVVSAFIAEQALGAVALAAVLATSASLPRFARSATWFNIYLACTSAFRVW